MLTRCEECPGGGFCSPGATVIKRWGGHGEDRTREKGVVVIVYRKEVIVSAKRGGLL